MSQPGAFAFKEESVAGVVETITPPTGLLRVETGAKVEIDFGMEDQNIKRDSVGKLAQRVTNKTAKVTIPNLEIKGSGTPGTEPACGIVIETSGFTKSVLSGWGVSYVPTTGLINDNIKTGTAKEFVGRIGSSGKYKTARGVRGDISFKADAGKPVVANYEGQGVYAARGDSAVPTAPSNSPIAPIFHSADMVVAEHHATEYSGTDGALVELRDGAASNLKYALAITQGATSQKVIGIALNLTQQGTAGAGDIWITIEGDSAGSPDGNPITNGTSAKIDASTLCASARWTVFWFKDSAGHFAPPTLTNGTDYHIVVQGDYATDASNNIELDTEVCTGGNQKTQAYGASWAAVTLKNISCMIFCAIDPVEKFAGFELKMNNGVELEDDPNFDQGFSYGKITAQDPTIDCEPLEKTDALRDWIDTLEDGTDMFFHAQCGSTAGNISEWTCWSCKLTKAGEWGERKGDTTHPITLQIEDNSQLEFLSR